MEDETHTMEKSPSLKPCNNTTTTTANNHHNNKEQDRFLPIANVGRIM